MPKDNVGREAPGDTPITKQKKLNTRGRVSELSTTSTGTKSSTGNKSSKEPKSHNSNVKTLRKGASETVLNNLTNDVPKINVSIGSTVRVAASPKSAEEIDENNLMENE